MFSRVFDLRLSNEHRTGVFRLMSRPNVAVEQAHQFTPPHDRWLVDLFHAISRKKRKDNYVSKKRSIKAK
jgi:hypothetical protein